jgi:hypothetical protein
VTKHPRAHNRDTSASCPRQRLSFAIPAPGWTSPTWSEGPLRPPEGSGLPIACRCRPNVDSTAASGARLATLAVDQEFEGVTGRYFEGAKEIRPSNDSYDATMRADSQ